jgi:hypothetical protein
MSWTVQALKQTYPSIEWLDPIEMRWSDKVTYSCRVCIANLGMHAASPHQWPTFEDCSDHIKREHAA